MAEGYLKALIEKNGLLNLHVSSAGTSAEDGYEASSHSQLVMGKIGVDISGHRSSRLERKMLQDADMIVAMTDAHRKSVGAVFPQALSKTKLLLEFLEGKQDSIQDPFGSNLDCYSLCFDEMKPALDKLFSQLAEQHASSDDSRRSGKARH